MNLSEILNRDEGKTLEFKRDLSSPRNLLKTIVAFANTAGGMILIGVEDASRNPVGVSNPLDEEERLCNLLADGIEPRLLPDIEFVSWEDKTLLAIEVFPSPLRPHFLKSLGPAGVFVRLGSTNRQADDDLIAEIRRSGIGITFDEQPRPEFGVEAVDIQAARNIFLDQRNISESELETLRVLVRSGKRRVPTVGGLLLFGKNKDRIFPDAWVQCGRFVGRDRRHIFDHTDIRDHLPVLVERTVEFLKKHAMRGADLSQLRRRDVWSIPLSILREAVVNAVVHADYAQKGAPIRVSFFDDRIEIENPGILLPGLTVDDILQGVSKLRNRVIGRVFKELGLIEQWGSGIRRMFSEAHSLGLPAPRIDEIGMRYRITVFLADSVDAKANASQRQSGAQSRAQSGAHSGDQSDQVRSALRHAPLSMRELMAELNLNSKTGALKRTISELLTQNQIEYTIPEKPNSRLQKYRLTEEGMTRLR